MDSVDAFVTSRPHQSVVSYLRDRWSIVAEVESADFSYNWTSEKTLELEGLKFYDLHDSLSVSIGQDTVSVLIATPLRERQDGALGVTTADGQAIAFPAIAQAYHEGLMRRFTDPANSPVSALAAVLNEAGKRMEDEDPILWVAAHEADHVIQLRFGAQDWVQERELASSAAAMVIAPVLGISEMLEAWLLLDRNAHSMASRDLMRRLVAEGRTRGFLPVDLPEVPAGPARRDELAHIGEALLRLPREQLVQMAMAVRARAHRRLQESSNPGR